jgi:small subunit ribosomal protein S17
MSKRIITGVVTSATGNKTITVTRTSRETHPLYGKKFTASKKFHAHDEKNEAHIGDTVLIEECRPLSRTKTWTLSKILTRGQEKIEIKKTEVEEEMEVYTEGKTEEEE